VFVDGHPGYHVCVRPHGSSVPIRGTGGAPDLVHIWPPEAPSPRRPPGKESGEDTLGLWDNGMIRALVTEILASGAAPPFDWNANLPRLRAESARLSKN
jgi:hypothetical protein